MLTHVLKIFIICSHLGVVYGEPTVHRRTQQSCNIVPGESFPCTRSLETHPDSTTYNIQWSSGVPSAQKAAQEEIFGDTAIYEMCRIFLRATVKAAPQIFGIPFNFEHRSSIGCRMVEFGDNFLKARFRMEKSDWGQGVIPFEALTQHSVYLEARLVGTATCRVGSDLCWRCSFSEINEKSTYTRESFPESHRRADAVSRELRETPPVSAGAQRELLISLSQYVHGWLGSNECTAEKLAESMR